MFSYKICKTIDTQPRTEKKEDIIENRVEDRTKMPLEEQLKSFKQDLEKMKNKEMSYSEMRSMYG